MKPKSKPEVAATIASILAALMATKSNPSKAEEEGVPRREWLSVKTTFSIYYYLDLTRPIYFPLLLATASLWTETDDHKELFVWSFLFALIVMMASLLLRLRDYKQIEIQRNELLFRYTFLPDRVRHFDDYDGYVQVLHHEGGSYIYLVKDHKRAETIDLSFYKERHDLYRAISQNLKEIACIDPKKKWFFSHYFFWKRYKY